MNEHSSLHSFASGNFPKQEPKKRLLNYLRTSSKDSLDTQNAFLDQTPRRRYYIVLFSAQTPKRLFQSELTSC